MRYVITPKREFLIKIFVIFILVSLNIAIYFNGRDLSCDKCMINFESYKREHETSSNKVSQNFTVNISEIYDYFVDEYCLVEFDRDNGYMYKKNVEGIK